MREESGVAAGLLGLPSGGGGIAPLGDRFQPDLVRGSGDYAVPLACPKGPGDLQPSLALAYSTGAGNDAFGLGWRLGVLRIERRSDRGLPSYTDADDFTLGGADLLVPVGSGRYRPRSDTQGWFVDRVGDGWRIRDGHGRTRLLGTSAASRESGPSGEIFAWHLDEERDQAGSTIRYTYLADGGRLYLSEVAWSVFAARVAYEPRGDVLRNARAGFPRRTALRASAIELHSARLAPTLMRRYALSYDEAANGSSLLAGLELSTGVPAGAPPARFPPLHFVYSAFDPSQWDVTGMDAELAPPRLDAAGSQLVDLDADGLPDVLELDGDTARWWRNTGSGRFDGPLAVPGVPSIVSLSRGNVALADLDGDGRADLFAVDQPLELAFAGNGKGGFDPQPTIFAAGPSLGLDSPDTRLTDFDGDGVTDLLATGREAFLAFRHRPGVGWDQPAVIERVADLDRFPDVRFGDRGVRLADMTGDGLQDVVAVHGGAVDYWPALGGGHFDARVEMSNPPVLPAGYREDRLHLIDIDGDGCSDVVYLGDKETTVWLNHAGNGFGPPVSVPVAPRAGVRSIPADVLGDGRPGFVWSGPAHGESDTGYRFLRLGTGAPYLLTGIDNGMGGLSSMSYSTTTSMRQLDELDGDPWVGPLPVVVHVVAAIEQRDTATGRTATMSMRYHDGVWDGPNREFRGFVRARVESSGDDSVTPARQEVTFFQGDPDGSDLAERARQRALAGSLLSTATFEQTPGGWVLRSRSTQVWEARLEFDGPDQVWFPHVTRLETREVPGSVGAPDRVEVSELTDFDAHGNPGRRLRSSFADGEPPGRWIRSTERFTYTSDEVNWLVRLPVRVELGDGAGALFAVKVHHYDGPPFTGAPEGEATAGLSTAVVEARLLDSRLPADYVGGRDLAALGYLRVDGGPAAGWYVRSQSVRRDARGNVVEQRDPTGTTMTIAYDADALYPTASTDALGRTTTFAFEPRAGEPATATYPDGRRARTAYDALGRVIAAFETDDAGTERLVKAWAIDLSSIPVSVTSYAPRIDAGRDALLAADPLALADVAVSRVFYDGTGAELVQMATASPGPGGARRTVRTRRVTINPRGLVSVAHAPAFAGDLAWPGPPPAPDASSAVTRYDVNGSVVETVGPGPARFTVERDAFTVTESEGDRVARVERFDARGRLVRIEEHIGAASTAVTAYELDLDGRVAVHRDGVGAEVARWVYAGPGDAVRISQRDAGTRTYYRDAAGRLVERVGADGATLRYRFDALGRVTAIDHAPPAGPVAPIREVVYDTDPDPAHAPTGRFLFGRVAVVREAGNEFRFSYDRAGRPVREEQTIAGVTLAVGRQYDRQGHLVALTYPDGTLVPYARDATGVVTAVGGVADAVDYAADGELLAYALGNGVAVTMPRDPVSRRLTAISAKLATTTVRRLAYGYDDVGNITSLTDASAVGTEQSAFSYDGLHRLTGATVRADGGAGAVLRVHAYTYDDAGNLLHHGDAGAVDLAYADAAHPGRVTAVTHADATTTPVAYGPRGEVTSLGGLTGLELDPLDRLVRGVAPDGRTVTFAYDLQGRRVLKEVTGPAGTSRTRYHAGLWEQHEDRNMRHVFLGKLLLASFETPLAGPPASGRFHLCDHHGTVLVTTDAAGAVVFAQRYSPFGATLKPDVALDRYLGREADLELGVVQFGARFYAPFLGRFLSPDWYILENPSKAVRLPQGFNVYAYALNNPLIFKDPSGLWFGIDDLIVAAAGFVVGFVSGLVYGLANGQGWGSLLTALETGLTTAAGAWLGWTVAGPVGGVMGGMNGLLGGIHGIYDWSSPAGWFAFISDSTWNLIGTSLGNVVQIINLFYKDANYRDDLSRRQNRTVYEGGFALKKSFAFTQGNVISNAGQGTGKINASFIANHEELHVWQQRFFGPLFQATYVVWAVGGAIVGTVVWFWHTDTGSAGLGSLIETATYYDNPFETWAYKNDNNWPPSGSNPTLRW